MENKDIKNKIEIIEKFEKSFLSLIKLYEEDKSIISNVGKSFRIFNDELKNNILVECDILKEVLEEKEAFEILNEYKNLYYNIDVDEEKKNVSCAINTILKKYSKFYLKDFNEED